MNVLCQDYKKDNQSNKIISNLNSKSPVVWHTKYNYNIRWKGDYKILFDTISQIDVNTLHEFEIVYTKTYRYNKWILEDYNGIIYAEAVYKNDTLISLKKHNGYINEYDIDSICSFRKYCDTFSIFIKY